MSRRRNHRSRLDRVRDAADIAGDDMPDGARDALIADIAGVEPHEVGLIEAGIIDDDEGEDIGAVWRDQRRQAQTFKRNRVKKFEHAFDWIRDDALSIGFVVENRGRCNGWRFSPTDPFGVDIKPFHWWPATGRTNTDHRFTTWPELKAHLLDRLDKLGLTLWGGKVTKKSNLKRG